MVIWALISEGCRETVDLYLTEKQAHADLADALRDEPEWSGLLAALESILRRGMRRAGRGGDYVRMPAEIEANRAANEFARQNYLEDIEALQADERTRQFVQPLVPVADLVGETVAMIWDYVEP